MGLRVDLIPLKLSLQNFLSYKDEMNPLDLEGIHVACLCGDNGHGKSALIDAITWAVWGYARGKSQDSLIHFGESDMWVELEFQARETRYKVVRRHSRASRRGTNSKTDLQLQLMTPSGFEPMTGNSIRDTQSHLQELIGMDYDTFINSAFLLQGRADEFTNKSPGERKEILGKILRLNFYDYLQEKSRKRVIELDRSAGDIEATLVFIRKETELRPEYEKELNSINQEMAIVTKDQRRQEKEIDRLETAIREIELKSTEVHNIQSQLPNKKKELEYFVQEVTKRSETIHNFQKVISVQHLIETDYKTYTQAIKSNENMNEIRVKVDAEKTSLQRLRTLIIQEKVRLEERIKTLSLRGKQHLTPKIEQVDTIEKLLRTAETDKTALKEEENILNQDRITRDKLTTSLGEIKASLDQIQHDGREIRSKFDLLTKSTVNAICPVCQSTLEDISRHNLEENFRIELEAKRKLYDIKQAQLDQTESDRKALEKHVLAREVLLKKNQQEIEQKINTLGRDLSDSKQAKLEATESETELLKLRYTLEHEEYALPEHSELASIEKILATLAYSPEEHNKTAQILQRLQGIHERYQMLQAALKNLSSEQLALNHANKLALARREELDLIQKTIDESMAYTDDLAQLKDSLKSSYDNVSKMRTEYQDLFGRKTSVETQLKKLENLEHQILDKSTEINTLRTELDLYKELNVAFGKQGVQALLIESVLPQIEDEANRLLSRMTDGLMTLKLETQRELKSRKGDFAETLDITISDHLGPRNYELFSGGEAFRINIALRIALSKILARRSGAPLSTLFIDEGFGTQDVSGRERILDVLRAIENDFQQIIVITHLDELKESFPVRIQVEKRNGTSTCYIA